MPRSDDISPKLLGHYVNPFLHFLVKTRDSLVKNQIDQVPKDSVVFLSQPTPHINAVFGGLMALRAHQIGAAGAVVDGCLRDLQEHRQLNFPVSI